MLDLVRITSVFRFKQVQCKFFVTNTNGLSKMFVINKHSTVFLFVIFEKEKEKKRKKERKKEREKEKRKKEREIKCATNYKTSILPVICRNYHAPGRLSLAENRPFVYSKTGTREVKEMRLPRLQLL